MAKVLLRGSLSTWRFESTGKVESAMPSISSVYLLWASLSFLLTRCFYSMCACLSTGRLSVLAHLSQRLRMSYCDHLPSVVRPSSTHLNDFSSETPGPIFFKLHVEPSVKYGLKICTNGHSPLIKMAAMPIYSKNLLLQNQESFQAESWYVASLTQGLPCLFK